MTTGIKRSAAYDAAHALSLEVYLTPRLNAATVVYLGSGFADSSPSTTASRLAAHGVSVVSVEYRSPAHAGYAESVLDVHRGCSFIASNAAHFGLSHLASTHRLGIVGVSLGGWIASILALENGSTARTTDFTVAAVSPWSAPSDLWTGRRRSALEQRVYAGPSVEEQIIPDSNADALRAASPINQDLSTAPPFLFVHGDRDIVVPSDQSRWMHDALQRAGRESAILTLGGAGHHDPAFDDDAVLAAIAGWFQEEIA